MNATLVRFANVFFDLLLWISLWGIVDNLIVSIERKEKNRVFLYMIIFAMTIVGIYLVNGGFIFKHSLYN